MGKIILINTPIGNLGDLTPRVREALESGTLFAVEDTRVFKDLLGHLGLSFQGKRIFSMHDQSEGSLFKKLIQMAQNEDLYVASDAGSPIVSDPAYPLILEACAQGLKVESYSGVSSPIMALELSGLPPIPFQFHGFLPRESGKRARAFAEVGYGTHIFFEAPTRVEETLDELEKLHPEREVCVVRELSKKFEQVMRFRAGTWSEVKSQVNFKGEFVILFHSAEMATRTGNEVSALAQEILAQGAGPKLLAKLLGAILDRPTKDIYTELTRLKNN